MNLNEILQGFNAPLNEEQAWAICYQYASKDHHTSTYEDKDEQISYTIPINLDSIVFSKDGNVSIHGDETADSEQEVIENFGRLLFEALENTIADEDERALSPELERLIARMTVNFTGEIVDEDDEGYDGEDEVECKLIDKGPCTLDIVVKLCEEHLEQPNDASMHYEAVCRALITEALDLKTFLEKVSSARESLKSLANRNNNNVHPYRDNLDDSEQFPDLNFTEWAHMWIQVINNLRHGVTLKKIEGLTRNNIEYELTPYEILMEDIRQRKYTLRKVSANDDLPLRIRSNAHDVILDFIKSRPTLNPMQNRKLGPSPPRSKSLHELLIEQIHDSRSVPLRHVEPPDDCCKIYKKSKMGDLQKQLSSSKSLDLSQYSSANTIPENTKSKRKLIKAPALADFQLTDDQLSSDTDSDSENESTFALDSILSDDLFSTTANDESHCSSFKRHSVLSTTSSTRSSGTSGVSSSGGDGDDVSFERPSVFPFKESSRRKKVLPVELLPSPITSPGEVTDGTADTLTSPRNSILSRFTRGNSNVGLRRAKSMAVRPSAHFDETNSVMAADERRQRWRERYLREKSSQQTMPLPPPVSSSSPLAKRDKKDWNYAQGPSLHRTASERRIQRPLISLTGNTHDKWRYPMECLALTVEELVHIRQVLARAELEKYQGTGELYQNLKNGKICFNCRIRKFSMFWWASVCQICKQKICSKCMRKIRTPTEEYLHTPVYTLSPTLNSRNVEKARNFERSLSINPSSITLREQKGSLHNSQMLRQQYSTAGSSADRSRKMDACEECCDLITRIIQTNSLAAMQQSILPNAHESSTSTSRRAPAPLLSSYFRGIPRSSTTVGCTSGLLPQSSAVSSGCPPSRKISKDYNPALNS